MTNGTYVKLNTLPESVRSALRDLGYAKADIEIKASESVSVGSGGSQGRRSFFALLSLDGHTAHRISYGDWGGSNPFSCKQVDNDFSSHTILPGFAVITGSEASKTAVFATLHVHPSNLTPFLPITTPLSDKDKVILRSFKNLTSAGRKNEWTIYNPESAPTPEDLASLVARKLLKVNKAGSYSITTDGKNAV